jgi:hypothetical protein
MFWFHVIPEISLMVVSEVAVVVVVEEVVEAVVVAAAAVGEEAVVVVEEVTPMATEALIATDHQEAVVTSSLEERYEIPARD